jgi:hypothetical protein
VNRIAFTGALLMVGYALLVFPLSLLHKYLFTAPLPHALKLFLWTLNALAELTMGCYVSWRVLITAHNDTPNIRHFFGFLRHSWGRILLLLISMMLLISLVIAGLKVASHSPLVAIVGINFFFILVMQISTMAYNVLYEEYKTRYLA